MAVSMEAGTAVIFNLSPPPIASISSRRFCNPLRKSSVFFRTSLSSRISNLRTSNLRICNVAQPPNQGDFNGSSNGLNFTSTSVLTFAKGLLKFAFSNLLPLALVGGVALGFNNPELGCLAHKYSLSKYITCWLFFLSGLKSQDGDLEEVVKAWPAVFYGLASILLVCPLFSKLILKVDMVPQEFITGLAIFSCMPTTLNGGVALTQLVGGNSALALALTVLSVLLGILTVPLWITKFFADGYGVAIPTRQLFQSLLLTLIVPLILGKVLRNLFPDNQGIAEMLTAVIFTCLVGVGIYQLVKPPPSRRCGSPNGPPVTSPRIRLSDGRYLAYKVRGTTKENAKYKVIINHGFAASKDTYLPVSDVWLQELGILLVTFDRPGYAESDPNPHRSPKSDAFDIQELADQLELGQKFFVVGVSMGSYLAWGCLKYIPHRLAGLAFVVPVVNYWWPLLPSESCSKAYSQFSSLDQWRIRFIHYAPTLAWLMQRWIPFPTVKLILKNNPNAFNESDLAILKHLSEVHAPDNCDEGEQKILQQGPYESLYRDFVAAFGSWEFNPLELTNPFPENNNSSVHLWIGGKDEMVPKELLRHISQKLPWICAHEVPSAGHLFLHDKVIFEMILKSLILGDNPSFE